jgi:integrase
VKRISKAFRRIAIEAGLPDVTPHTLRHTAISWALQRGTKAFDVADYFGVSEEVIKRTYGHHDPEHHREVTARMDRRHLSAPVSRRASPLRQNGLFDEKPTV